MNIGKRLRELRIKNDLTQTRLAEKLGTTKQCISKLEKGRVVNYSISTILDLCFVLNTTPDYLMSYSNDYMINKCKELDIIKSKMSLIKNERLNEYILKCSELSQKEQDMLCDIIKAVFKNKGI